MMKNALHKFRLKYSKKYRVMNDRNAEYLRKSLCRGLFGIEDVPADEAIWIPLLSGSEEK